MRLPERTFGGRSTKVNAFLNRSRELDAVQMKMPDVILVMRLDIAPIVVRILELPLDQQIGAVNVIRILLRFEHGLVVVAGDGRGYIVGVKTHSSPRPCPVSLFFDLDERLSDLRATAHLGE